VGAETYAYHEEMIGRSPNRYMIATRRALQSGDKEKASDYVRGRWRLELLRRKIDDGFENVDLIVLPTRRRTPRTVDASIKREETDVPRNPELENTGAFNAYGIPAISVPCAFTSAGLPVGLMIAGPRFPEGKCWRWRARSSRPPNGIRRNRRSVPIRPCHHSGRLTRIPKTRRRVDRFEPADELRRYAPDHPCYTRPRRITARLGTAIPTTGKPRSARLAIRTRTGVSVHGEPGGIENLPFVGAGHLRGCCRPASLATGRSYRTKQQPRCHNRSKHTSRSDSSARRRTWSEQRPRSSQFVVDDRVPHSGIDPFVDSRIHGAEHSGGLVNSLERDM
jgi:Amidase